MRLPPCYHWKVAAQGSAYIILTHKQRYEQTKNLPPESMSSELILEKEDRDKALLRNSCPGISRTCRLLFLALEKL